MNQITAKNRADNMRTDYLASTASAYCRLIRWPHVFKGSLQAANRRKEARCGRAHNLHLSRDFVFVWTHYFLFHRWGIQSNSAQTCWARSRVFSGPSVARQAEWATRGIDLATGFVFSVCVCSSVEPRITKRPFFFSFLLMCVGLCVVVAACSV